MSTSDRHVALEAVASAALVLGAAALFSPGDLFIAGLGFHPAWIAVLVLAARYGTSGLLLSIALTWGSLAAATLALGRPLAGLAPRLGLGADAYALAAAILVAWIASLHAARTARFTARLTVAEVRLHEAEDLTDAMRDSLAFLRGRHDRMEVSLSLWRDISARLERGDAADAAQAALELCALRCGAAAGMVQGWDGVSLHALASHGQWSPSQSRRHEVPTDSTAVAAVTARRAILASEVPGASCEDSDVAVPVLDGRGAVLGVIALRGVSPARLSAADLSDLSLTADWLAPALQRRSPVRKVRKEAIQP
jgi:hypothetical protein